MAYKKRSLPIRKECANPLCKAPFETWHNSQKYCGQSCNQTSWRRRKGISQAKEKDSKTSETKIVQAFDWRNIGIATAGSLTADSIKSVGKFAVGYESDELKEIKQLRTQISDLKSRLEKITVPIQKLVEAVQKDKIQKWAPTFNPDILITTPKNGQALFTEYSNGVETLYVNTYLRIILKPEKEGRFSEVRDTGTELKLLPTTNT